MFYAFVGGPEWVGMQMSQDMCGDQKTILSVDACCQACLSLDLFAISRYLGRLASL